MNKLYYGDCLAIMNEWPSSCIDLIYLDPPFNSNREYNSIYEDETGKPLPEQINAFCDQWTLDEERERAIREMPILMREAGIDDEVAEFWRTWVNALRKTQPNLLAYLSYMVQRLLIMRVLLKPTGSIYLHCDFTAVHYIKVMMDGIFGHKNFRNEIIWKRVTSNQKGSQHSRKSWGNNADTILFYTKSNNHCLDGTRDLTKKEVNKKFNKCDKEGRLYYDDSSHLQRTPNMGERPNLCYEWRGFKNRHPSGWRLSKKRLEEEYQKGNIVISPDGKKLERRKYEEDYAGVPIGNIWTDIKPVRGKEGMGYKTEKPVELLERIIKASSKEGDVVLDPFCGCATTVEAAHRLGRKWIGIDIAIHAIKRVAKKRLEKRLHLVEGKDFIIEGIPNNLEGAKDLWNRDRYHFQKWCVEIVEGFVTAKKTVDGGIDGRIYFDTGEKELKSMVLEVKGGKNISIVDLRALQTVMEYNGAEMAGFIIMEPLGDRQRKNFHQLMAKTGDLVVSGKAFPRMQMLTVQEILDGQRFYTPFSRGKQDLQISLIP